VVLEPTSPKSNRTQGYKNAIVPPLMFPKIFLTCIIQYIATERAGNHNGRLTSGGVTILSNGIESLLVTSCGGWGLHFRNDNPGYLGLAQDHMTRVFVASLSRMGIKYVHGYPADHQKKQPGHPNGRNTQEMANW